MALNLPESLKGETPVTERRTAKRYDLTLPIMVAVAGRRPDHFFSGQVLNISTSGVYFQLDESLEPGTELLLTLSLPVELTRGLKVLVRATGRVMRVDSRGEKGSSRHGIASRIERYDIIRPRVGATAAA
jgi:hypothetical protein